MGQSSVSDAYEVARAQFEEFAGLDAPNLPGDAVNAMQIRLMRWQHGLFSFEPRTHDLVLALGVVEEIGETLQAKTQEEALDGLGDVCVYAGQLLIANRLALAPVLELAVTADPDGPGGLAHVVGKRSQRTRGYDDDGKYRKALVVELAVCIATAMDVAYRRWQWPSVMLTYLHVGEQVLMRKRGDVMVPAEVAL